MANKVPLPGSQTPVSAPAVSATPAPVHIGGESLLDRLLPHVRTLAKVAAALGALLIAFFLYQAWSDGRKEAATAKTLDVLDVLARPASPTAGADGFASSSERAKAAMAKGAPDLLSPIAVGRLALDAGNFDAAETAFRKIASSTDGKRGLGAVAEARYWAATDAAEKTKHLDAALAAYRSAGVDATYDEGRILALKGQVSEARAALEKALVSTTDDAQRRFIEARLAQLPAQPAKVEGAAAP